MDNKIEEWIWNYFLGLNQNKLWKIGVTNLVFPPPPSFNLIYITKKNKQQQKSKPLMVTNSKKVSAILSTKQAQLDMASSSLTKQTNGNISLSKSLRCQSLPWIKYNLK